jgi:hypothetical protein
MKRISFKKPVNIDIFKNKFNEKLMNQQRGSSPLKAGKFLY